MVSIKNNHEAAGGSEPGCVAVEEILSRFLDNDLPGREATRVVAHLHACTSCHARFEVIRAQQAAIHTLPMPQGEQGARERVLSRLEREIRQREPNAAPSRARLAFPALALRFAAPALAAAWIAAFCLLHNPLPHNLTDHAKGAGSGTRTTLAAETRRAWVAHAVATPAPIKLPAKEEMVQLFALHDQRSAAAFKATAALAAPHPSAPAASAEKATTASRSTHQHNSEIAAGERSAGPLSADIVGSDAIPEAL